LTRRMMPRVSDKGDEIMAGTVVFVHGAWADGSCWNKVIPILREKGLKVMSVQNPLTSLADDVAAVHRTLAAQEAPVLLVGHSWGGMVITEAGTHEKVAGLVYVATVAAEAGETMVDLIITNPPMPGTANLAPDEFGFFNLPLDVVQNHFAQDLPDDESYLVAVTQGPFAAKCFEGKISTPAWKSKPAWSIVATEDHMIPPQAERSTAERANAKVTELPTSHVPMVSKPAEVAAVIVQAAEAVGIS
jgi:pimeloyl-ACP methyl ester carboxylesterase